MLRVSSCCFLHPTTFTSSGKATEIIALSAPVKAALGAALLFQSVQAQSCRCSPNDSCWPSTATWNSLNSTVSGKLIANVPPAQVCYPGPDQNPTACAAVDDQWSNATFQSDQSIGLSYPLYLSCPPVNVSAGATAKAGGCSIADNPQYTVKATTPQDIAAAIAFASKNNVRLVIKDTGHDLLGRSTGYGSLQAWTRYIRTGITYQATYKSSTGCSKTNWTGSAITIGGDYTWEDVYPVAAENNVVVVGGGTPTVGCLGGWMQGGGHGPASHQHGLGADQVLEAKVVLANGSLVTASACENPDLYFALRGGGGGTYGVVVETVVKTYPNAKMVANHLAVASLTSNVTSLYEAIATIWSSFPAVNDAGYAGYGQWAVGFAEPLFSNVTTGYVHSLYAFGQTVKEAQAAFAPLEKKLQAYNGTSLFVSSTFVAYPDYWTFYGNESGVEPAVGTLSVVGSRLFDGPALTGNMTGLVDMMSVIAGTPGQFVSNNFELVSGGQVFKDASDPYSGVNPAWRTSYMNNICALGLASTSSQSVIAAGFVNIDTVKIPAMQAQAPNTGVYMNEGSRDDPNYEQDFYGSHYQRLLSIKQTYDPESVFYCPTCVGSSAWAEVSNGTLCRKPASSSSSPSAAASSASGAASTASSSSATTSSSGSGSSPSAKSSASILGQEEVGIFGMLAMAVSTLLLMVR